MADPSNLQKKYLYKAYTPAGTFLGLIQNVSSKFRRSQFINTAGTQLEITVKRSADTANESVENLETEDGQTLTTEDNRTLTTERVPDLVGAANANALIANDNLIKIYEISRYNPNGVIVFSGFVQRWSVDYGDTEDVTVTCINLGQDLANYLVPGSTANTADQSQTNHGDATSYASIGSGAFVQGVGQTFTVGASATNISAIDLWGAAVSTPALVTVKLYSTVNGTLLGTTSNTFTSTTPAALRFTFSTPIDVTTGDHPFIGITAIADQANIFTATSDIYAGGAGYADVGSGWTGGGTANDIYFVTYYLVNTTSNTFTSTDPSTILTTIMADYSLRGGAVTPDTYTTTGVSATYTFNLNTVLEGIQQVQKLGPATWYYYVDPATNILYYKASATTADHTLIKGRHLNKLDILATKENIVNVVYFTGGDDGTGSNVYVNVNDTSSLLVNRRGLARLNNPKVTGASGVATGTLLAQNDIDQNSEETYQTQVIVVDDTYDINTFNLGQMVKFAGFGTFADNLLLQIVGIDRQEDQATLSVGTLPIRTTAQVEAINASLQATQTVDNPSAPS